MGDVPSRRTPASLLISMNRLVLTTVLLFAIVSALGNETNELHNEVLETSFVEAEDAADELLESTPAEALVNAMDVKMESSRPVLLKISRLKAYCMAAYDQANQLYHSKGSQSSTLLPFMVEFGSPKNKNKNAVTEYAKIMVKLKKKSSGIWRYYLHALNKAVLSQNKEEIVRTDYPIGYTSLSHKALGITGEPSILLRMAVLNGKFANQWQTVKKSSMGADGMAALAWLKKGAKGKYASFLAKEKAYWANKVATAHKKVMAAAIKAAKGAYGKGKSAGATKVVQVHVQSKPARTAAHSAYPKAFRGIKVPTPKEMKKAAAKRAQRWMARAKAKIKGVVSSTKKVVKMAERIDKRSKKKKSKKKSK